VSAGKDIAFKKEAIGPTHRRQGKRLLWCGITTSNLS